MLPRLPLLVGLADQVFGCRISGTLLARQVGHVSEALDFWLSKDLTAQGFLDFHGIEKLPEQEHEGKSRSETNPPSPVTNPRRASVYTSNEPFNLFLFAGFF